VSSVVDALAPLAPFVWQHDDVPHPWTGSVQDLNWLARPLLAHVGLAHLDVYLEVFSGDARVSGFGEDHGLERALRPHDDTRVWFTGVTHGLVVLACTDDDVALDVAKHDLAHAVAHVVLTEQGHVLAGTRADRAVLDAAARRLGLLSR
jgi:hypothetical protein